MTQVLQIRDLETVFYTRVGTLRAINKVSFSVNAGETLAIVGESGCGKSVTALSIMGLVSNPPGEVVGGQVLFNDRDLLKLSPKEMRQVRGNDISMVFQEPMSSLNPVLSVGDQISEGILEHEQVSRRVAWRRSVELLDLVRIPNPHQCVREYPHRLSGGMRQRVMIAMAVACNPLLLIADEPTTALDVTTQAQVLRLLNNLKEELGMALILITHDLGVVAETANRVVVMYAGNKVEEASVENLFERPLHPYTEGLLGAIPRINREENHRSSTLTEIDGIVPSLLDLPKGCAFSPRCPNVIERCHNEAPHLAFFESDHQASCFVAQSEILDNESKLTKQPEDDTNAPSRHGH
jgi:peptide/nickel transport system ATP-binding protein